MNHKIEPSIGDTLHSTITDAKDLAVRLSQVVELKFNGITCLVNADTNSYWLDRDYSNALKMGWKSVGPNPVEHYSPETQSVIDKKDQEIAEQNTAHKAESEKQDALVRAAFQDKTRGIEPEWLDVAKYEDWKAKNTDSYRACIFEYAESWAKLMQYEMGKGKSLADCAEETSFELSHLGITGYMYGKAVGVLAECWIYGETLRKWHNGEYNHKGAGIVNPAIITINHV